MTFTTQDAYKASRSRGMRAAVALQTARRNLAEHEEAAAREEAREILAERRDVKGGGDYPALCAAIRSRVSDLLDSIRESRGTRARLAEGDESELIFYPDARLKAAFCDGAELSEYPA